MGRFNRGGKKGANSGESLCGFNWQETLEWEAGVGGGGEEKKALAERKRDKGFRLQRLDDEKS